MKGYIPPQNAQEEIFCRQVKEAAVRCEKILRPVYTGFLDERQQQLAAAQLAGSKWSQHLFFGGSPSAERKVLCVYSDRAPQSSEFPISAVKICCGKDAAGLSHRDYLGSLMGLGLERKCMGDIFVQPDGAVVFALTQQAKVICDSLFQIGRIGARADICQQIPDELLLQNGEETVINVASLRLDAVLAAALHLSRQKASAIIASGKVMVSHIEVNDSSYPLDEKNTITVRGYGKFCIKEVGGKSKKDRTFLTLIKY